MHASSRVQKKTKRRRQKEKAITSRPTTYCWLSEAILIIFIRCPFDLSLLSLIRAPNPFAASTYLLPLYNIPVYLCIILLIANNYHVLVRNRSERRHHVAGEQQTAVWSQTNQFRAFGTFDSIGNILCG